MAFFSLDKLINLHDGYRRAFRIDSRELLLVQEDGERWLLARRCPHAGQALDTAALRDATIQCPRHGYRFCLRTGAPRGAACAALQVYPLVYEGNAVGFDDRA